MSSGVITKKSILRFFLVLFVMNVVFYGYYSDVINYDPDTSFFDGQHVEESGVINIRKNVSFGGERFTIPTCVTMKSADKSYPHEIQCHSRPLGLGALFDVDFSKLNGTYVTIWFAKGGKGRVVKRVYNKSYEYLSLEKAKENYLKEVASLYSRKLGFLKWVFVFSLSVSALTFLVKND